MLIFIRYNSKKEQNMKQIALILFLTLMGISTPILKGQNLVLKSKTGTEQIKKLSSLKLITFSNNNLLINYSSIPSETYHLSTISKLYFNSLSTGTENKLPVENNLILSIYPNPATNVIYLQNAPDEISIVAIYRMDGTMALQTQISKENKCIQIGNLSKGLYLLKVNNQAFKFIKL